MPKEKKKPLEAKDLKIGSWYRGKRFLRGVCVNNDRKVMHIGGGMVQYDSDTVKSGRHYPRIPMERFLKWASHEVTPAESEASR